ncbi:hypothetical protein COEREDRAFT_79642 [Coemansia reversa NRRL 1564]|uniref:Zn(2)-C6 fungal-type domain-containing protein n=1 Tax=Coemansia reversa (strain ATCC 12441 / NRRL 1564) TaxID=763665 RepID=A0A2G5BI07_COERN|nr:hypothetical protein COEREDRAFT_79642 [Coemansia reversa NRRL 1564]|eukprot:PIA18612.1 hypothetical protein COEREDRAFT_79642 [Coemansia reversa NRRL 1564]
MPSTGSTAASLLPTAAATTATTSLVKAVRTTGRGAKPHVPSACTNCKRAHLACDLQRPCRRCVNTGKCETCKDVQHKKRGRPRSKDKKPAGGSTEEQHIETQMFQFSFSGTSTVAASAGAASPPTATEAAAVGSSVSICSMSAASLNAATPIQPLSPASSSPHNNSASSSTIAPTATPFDYDAPLTSAASTTSASNTNTLHGSTASAPVHAQQQLLPHHASDAAAGCTSYLFLTPGLLCLRLEEICRAGAGALLGHSLLSLINRSAMDFVSELDRPRVLQIFEAIRQRLSARLAHGPSRAYAHAVLGHPPPPVDPNTFQAVPVDRLLQRVCADICGDMRAHLQTAGGNYDLFDIHVFVGAVPKPPYVAATSAAAAELVFDEVYFVCRITKFDAFTAAQANPHQPYISEPNVLGTCCGIHSDAPEAANGPGERPHKRRCAPKETFPSDPLFLLGAAANGDLVAHCGRSVASSKQSSQPSSPMLTTLSPSLTATTSRSGALPPLSDLLRSLTTTTTGNMHCSPSYH